MEKNLNPIHPKLQPQRKIHPKLQPQRKIHPKLQPQRKIKSSDINGSKYS
jgi:hypothetical protein